jgi:hypothetical protein
VKAFVSHALRAEIDSCRPYEVGRLISYFLVADMSPRASHGPASFDTMTALCADVGGLYDSMIGPPSIPVRKMADSIFCLASGEERETVLSWRRDTLEGLKHQI